MVNLFNAAEDTYRPAVGLGRDIDLQFARHQFNRREYAVSEFYLKKTLANQPDNREALQLLPWAYFFQKRFDKALASFKQAHTLHKKDPTPLLGMGWSYFTMKQYQKALDSLSAPKGLPRTPTKSIKGRLSSIWNKDGASLQEKNWKKFFSPSR